MPQLLFVCHGNVARSAAAEVITRRMMSPSSGWTVASAGVGALVGQPVADTVAASLQLRGYDPSGHKGRQVHACMLKDADIVVCMESAHRRWLVDEAPTTARRIFVFGQLERIARLAPRRVDGLAHAMLHQAPAKSQDDVADPFRLGPQAAEKAVTRLETGLAVIGPLLGFIPRGPGN